MADNKDIKELMAARKERRAVPQIDPAEIVHVPEPEFIPTPIEPGAPKPSAAAIEQQAELVPTSHHPQDSRYVPVPRSDTQISKTYKYYQHRYRQLLDEKHFTGKEIQDILDVALGEYFEKRYGTPKEPI